MLKKIINKFFSLNRILEYKRAKLIQQNGLLALSSITKLLAQNNIYYWVDAGTLLGIVRDNDFIKNDSDIDIAVVMDNPNLLYDLLLENDYNIWYFYEDKDKRKTLIRAEKYNVGIDFEMFVRKDDRYSYEASRDLPLSVRSSDKNKKAIFRFEFDSTVIENLTLYPFKGIEVMIPEDYDRYFTVYYENWKEKVKKRDYLNSYFSMSVDKYKHHNNSAYYVPNEYLYFTLVHESSIKVGVKDVIDYYFRKK